MASGDPVVQVLESMPLSADFAPNTQISGGSTPGERATVWPFDDSTIEYRDYKCYLKGYGGGGLTLTLPWSSPSATTGVARLGAAIRRIQDDAEDFDTSHTYDYNDVDDTTASAAGELSYPTITFTDGADMDNLADGEMFILRVRRNASHANDTLVGDAELWYVLGKET